MSDERVRKLLGKKFARLRKEAGYKSQGDLARRIGVDRSMISQIETGRRGIPENRVSGFAQALGVDSRELTAASLGGPQASGYVESPDDISTWRDRVAFDQSLPWQAQVILVSLAARVFLDRDSWVVAVTKDQFIRETGRSRELVDGYWINAMGSDYVERIGEVEWVVKLKFPDRG
ncbi:MAG: helix-turn-helix domain-containing protein [Persicimonas sp.]